MTRLTEMQFEEVPLVAQEGFEALFADGWVDINYWPDGSFTLGQIELEAISCTIDPPHKGKVVRKRLKCDGNIQSMIRVRLMSSALWIGHIKDHIASQMRQAVVNG